MGINVLSLFDGMSCGRIALERAGIEVDSYYASEIDPHAMKIAIKNYPSTKLLGCVKNLSGSMFRGINLLLGGSPCQGFSFGGKQLNFDDPRSKLFFEYVRILKEVKPKYFLLENVPMKKEYLDVITKELGVEPIMIDSADFGAMHRKRYYWTNIPVDTERTDTEKNLIDYLEDIPLSRAELIKSDFAEKILSSKILSDKNSAYYLFEKYLPINFSSSGRTWGVENRTTLLPDKALTLTASGYSSRSFTGVWYPSVNIMRNLIRKLTITEMERLQTVPDGYTEGVTESQRRKMLGNGWTVDVIAHLLKNMER